VSQHFILVEEEEEVMGLGLELADLEEVVTVETMELEQLEL
jgi:hypothetical protein